MPTSVKNIQNLERLSRELKKLREVEAIELFPNCQKDVDAYIKARDCRPKKNIFF